MNKIFKQIISKILLSISASLIVWGGRLMPLGVWLRNNGKRLQYKK